MTIYEHLDARRRDIDEKVARNGLTSGLVVQKREVMKKLERLSIEDGSKEYVPEVKKPHEKQFTTEGWDRGYN